jgi:type 1 glutamine amidotransferase
MRMHVPMKSHLTRLAAALFLTATTGMALADDRHLLLIAGRDSHGPLAHNHKEGMNLFAAELAAIQGLKVSVATEGWPEDESLIDQADAIVIYADGFSGHPALQGDRLARLQKRVTEDGIGIGMVHFAVHVPVGTGSEEFKAWIGGHYESDYSCNPMWTAKFESFPNHPITTGVEPFEHHDEWYFNMRFRENMEGITPILVAKPSDETRDGPYVHPKGPYPHIQAAKGRDEVLMWAVEREDGGRGFGFTGGHFHKGWDLLPMRRIVLNAMLWVSKVEIPEGGAPFTISTEESDARAAKTEN